MRALARSTLRPYVCASCRSGAVAGRRRFASSNPQVPDVYDVVCVGGGPAGLGLLAALRASPATSNLRVALIETQDLEKARSWTPEGPTHFSNRVSSLTPSSVSFLKQIGAWENIETDRVQEYQEMQVWDGETGSRLTFDWSMETSPFESLRTVATMTENSNLVRSLLRKIDASKGNGTGGVSIFSNTTVQGIENGTDYHPDGPDLSAWPVVSIAPTGNGSGQTSQIAARLLVGADGINSPVRRFADITTDGWDYNRQGVVATLALAEPTQPVFPVGTRTAYQRFLPALGGPIALLPMPNNHATLVWSTTAQNAAYLKSLKPQSFLAMVNAAFRLSMTDLKYMMGMQSSPDADGGENPHEDELTWRLNHTPQQPDLIPPPVTALQTGSLASFPLRFRHASSYISPRVALVGDAAHVVHPLAGQGLNLGLGDVASLAKTIDYAATHGMDVGDILSLEAYPAERFAVNAKMGGMCDFLHRVYNVEGQGPVAWGRSLGVEVIDRVPFLKGFLMKSAA